MRRTIAMMLFMAFGLFVGCATAPDPNPLPAAEEESETTATQSEEARPARPAQIPIPQPLRLVGEESVGNAIEAELEAEGIEVTGSFVGRQSGIESFCRGDAEGLALSKDLDDAERKTCKQLGGGWSALSDDDGRILYVKYAIGSDFLARSTAF